MYGCESCLWVEHVIGNCNSTHCHQVPASPVDMYKLQVQLVYGEEDRSPESKYLFSFLWGLEKQGSFVNTVLRPLKTPSAIKDPLLFKTTAPYSSMRQHLLANRIGVG